MNKNYVFQIGIICAGSTSLCEALNILGIPSLHYRSPFPDDKIFETEVIPENIKLNRRLFYPYDEKWRGFLDFDGHEHYKTLYEMYPESKFIYTWREYEPWLRSALKLTRNQYRENHNRDMPDEEFAELIEKRPQYWNRNYQEMNGVFKNNPRFLQMKICDGGGDGWEKLCNFLEMPIPNVDFPHLRSNNWKFDDSVD